ncbi:MAG: L-serine ammonia-lyase, iron-sulfur-dependent subunit beta [Trueperaceae bacterium]
MGLLDVIGPVMIGPSSSHTAGACRLALLARHARHTAPARAELTLHGSFAKTARGHGTELALVAGLLGMQPDDPRLPEAHDHAEASGLQVAFRTADLGDVHPNTVRIETHGAPDADPESVALTGSSLGGGLVRVFEVDGFRVEFRGGQHTLLIRHHDQPGVIARVARVLADDDSNVATLHCARRKRGGEAMMSVEIDRGLSGPALNYLAHLPYVTWLRMLPEVLSGKQPPVDPDDPDAPRALAGRVPGRDPLDGRDAPSAGGEEGAP